jgi:hypothetical protein
VSASEFRVVVVVLLCAVILTGAVVAGIAVGEERQQPCDGSHVVCDMPR